MRAGNSVHDRATGLRTWHRRRTLPIFAGLKSGALTRFCCAGFSIPAHQVFRFLIAGAPNRIVLSNVSPLTGIARRRANRDQVQGRGVIVAGIAIFSKKRLLGLNRSRVPKAIPSRLEQKRDELLASLVDPGRLSPSQVIRTFCCFLSCFRFPSINGINKFKWHFNQKCKSSRESRHHLQICCEFCNALLSCGLLL